MRFVHEQGVILESDKSVDFKKNTLTAIDNYSHLLYGWKISCTFD